MPKRLAAKPKPLAVSRTMLDQKLAELYSVSPRTIRLWRRKGAPLDEPGEMTDWIADLRRQGKGDGPDVRAARIRKLTLQIEALELTEQSEANRFVPRAKWRDAIEPMIVEIRRALRELLIDKQPTLLAHKSTNEIRELSTAQYHAFCAHMHAWTQAHATPDPPEALAAPTVADSDASPRGKPGRVADPEMEALRLRKLTLECQVLERENRLASGDLLPLEEYGNRMEEQFGTFRAETRQLFKDEQPATLPGRTKESVLEYNRKSLKHLYRRLRAVSEKLLDATPAPDPETDIP